jgi:predicted GH43/DUF377 family glycosyl hydrolase
MWYTGGQGPLLGQIGYATSTDGIFWQKYGNMPVMEEGPSGSWDHQAVGWPTVVIVNDTCHMWYTGASDEIVVQIGYATSTDGINWTKYENNPVIRVGTADSWEDTWIYEPCVIYHESVFYMWYTGVKGDWTDYDPWENGIGYATSKDGFNWTKHASNPVLKKNTAGNWDDFLVCEQTVLFHNDIFHMWYQGLDSAYTYNSYPIGYATSADGITWQRSESNPVLIPSGWELPRIQHPHVILTDSIYQMWYSAGDEFLWETGYATSADGINWIKHPEPVLKVWWPTDIDDNEKHIIPAEYILYQNYPNPFNSTATIEYTVGANGCSPVHVDLSIYNTLGQKISTLVSEKQPPGKQWVKWNAQGFPPGLYYYRITAGAYSAMKKMFLIK